MSALILCDHPATQIFAATQHGREQLQKVLDNSYRYTRVGNPSSPRELRLEPKTKRTQEGFRYITSAFSKVCNSLAPNLSRVITNVAGDGNNRKHSDSYYDVSTACSIFNQVVDLRFDDALSPRQLVIDESAKTIEGCLGPRTHYIENASFVDMVEPLLTSVAEAEFGGATLVGRRLFIKYLKPGVEQFGIFKEEFRRGYAFCITESGDDSIHAYGMLMRVKCGSCCLSAVGSKKGRYRQKRMGSQFSEKLRYMLQSLLYEPEFDYDAAYTTLASRTLITDASDDGMKKQLIYWVRRMKLAGLPADIAKQVLGKLFSLNSDMSRPLTDAEICAKTEYDLFLAIMDDGRKRNQRIREMVESSAFSLFFGD